MVESKIWVWTAKETAELQTESLEMGPDQVLVKTRYTGVSPGTEMALYMMKHVGFADPNNHYAEYPHKGGYLNVGIVEDVGANVADKWKKGDWVFSAASHRQYSLMDPTSRWERLMLLPEVLRVPEACLLGMVTIGYTAEYLAPAILGETVTVLGGGMVGNFAAQLYKAAGAAVLLVEKDEFRRDIAAECGLETVASIEDVAKHYGEAPKTVVEATGVPQLSVEAMRMAAQGGRVVILSSPRGEAPVSFYNDIHAKLLTVIGAHGKAVTDGAAALKLMAGLCAEGTVKLKPCLTHMVSWQKAPEVWDTYAKGASKRLGTVFDWSE